MYITSYLKEFFSTLTLEWIAVIATAAIALSVFMLHMKRKGRLSVCKAALVVGLAVYILTVFVATVFARKPKSEYDYQLILFWSYY